MSVEVVSLYFLGGYPVPYLGLVPNYIYYLFMMIVPVYFIHILTPLATLHLILSMSRLTVQEFSL